MSKIWIAHVPYLFRGGEDIHADLLKKAYENMGFEAIFLPLNRTPTPVSLNEAYQSLSSHADVDFDELYQKDRPEFIHLNNPYPLLGPRFLRWVSRKSIPLFFTVHNHRFFCSNGLALRGGEICKDCFHSKWPWRSLVYNCNQDYKKSAYYALALKNVKEEGLLENAVTQWIAPSPYIQDELIRSGVPAEKINLLINPIELPKRGQTKDLQKKVDVFFAGRLSEEKGVSELLECIAKTPGLNFKIAGEGPLKEMVTAFAGKNKNLEYIPHLPRDKIFEAIESARICILNSICNEILPTFVLESFSSGKRCVVPDRESTRWLAQGQWKGVLADPKSVSSLQKAIASAIEKGDLSESETAVLREKLSFSAFCNKLKKITETSQR